MRFRPIPTGFNPYAEGVRSVFSSPGVELVEWPWVDKGTVYTLDRFGQLVDRDSEDVRAFAGHPDTLRRFVVAFLGGVYIPYPNIGADE